MRYNHKKPLTKTNINISEINPNTNKVITSSAGAVGPSQILPGTGVQYAREMGDKRPASEIIKQLKQIRVYHFD